MKYVIGAPECLKTCVGENVFDHGVTSGLTHEEVPDQAAKHGCG